MPSRTQERVKLKTRKNERDKRKSTVTEDNEYSKTAGSILTTFYKTNDSTDL